MVAPAQPTYTRGQSYIDQLLAALRMGMSPPQLPGQGGVQRALEGYMNEPMAPPGPGGGSFMGGAGQPNLDLVRAGLSPGGLPPIAGGLGGGGLGGGGLATGIPFEPPSLPGDGGGLPTVGAPPPGGGLPPVAPPPGLPSAGGGGSFMGGAGQPNLDVARAAGQGPPASALPGGLGGALGGADLSPDVADAIYADPSLALRNQFRDAGLSPDNNPYVRMAMARLQPVVAALADFQGIINAGAGAAATGDELKTVLPGLIAGLVSGKLNGRQILDQILGMADDDEIKTFLAEMGAPRLLELQGNLSGTSARRQQARARYQGNKIADVAARQQAAAGRGEDVDEREWLKIVRGR